MIEFSRMLCPVDFSDPSRAALESALMLARWYRSTVHVPYVVQIALPALRHRLLLNFEGQAEGILTDDVLKDIVANTPRTLEQKVDVP